MKIKNIICLLIISNLFIINGVADENFYAISNNIITSNNFKVILESDVKSDILIDSENIYFYTNNNFYVVNDSGRIIHKLYILDIKEQTQTDNFIYLNTEYNIFKINKLTGSIEGKNQTYITPFNKIYSLFNIQSSLDIQVNNTDLAEFQAGHNGTNERINGITYNTSNTIQLFVFSHAQTPSQNGHIILNINGTNISHTSLRPLGTSEETNTQIISIIPSNSNYTVYFSNYHHYEWREYPISGTGTGIKGDKGENGTNGFNQSDNTKLNKTLTTSDYLIGDLNLSGDLIFNNQDSFIYNINPFDQSIRLGNNFISAINNFSGITTQFILGTDNASIIRTINHTTAKHSEMYIKEQSIEFANNNNVSLFIEPDNINITKTTIRLNKYNASNISADLNEKVNKSGDIYYEALYSSPIIYQSSNGNVVQTLIDDTDDGTYVYKIKAINPITDSRSEISISDTGFTGSYQPNSTTPSTAAFAISASGYVIQDTTKLDGYACWVSGYIISSPNPCV